MLRHGPNAAQPVGPGERLQPQQMIQNRVSQRRTAGIVAVRHLHHPAAVVGQQTQIAIVATPGAAAMTNKTGAAIIADKEAKAVVCRVDLDNLRGTCVDLRRLHLPPCRR